MAIIPLEDTPANNTGLVSGGAFNNVEDTASPFGYKRGEGFDRGHGEHDWIVNREKPKYDEVFKQLNPVDGKVSGMAAKSEMVKSKLPNSVLSKVWKLADDLVNIDMMHYVHSDLNFGSKLQKCSDKTKVWFEFTQKFIAASLDNVFRPTDALKKYNENLKTAEKFRL